MGEMACSLGGVVMPKYTVEEVLEIIQSLSPEEKHRLTAALPSVLTSQAISPSTAQTSTTSIGGDFRVSGTGVSVDFSQTQTVGQPPPADGLETGALAQQLLQALEELRQSIATNPELNEIQKATAVVPLEAATGELKKEQPDKTFVGQAIATLKKGLEGVQTLAEPTIKVAELLAKAWVVL